MARPNYRSSAVLIKIKINAPVTCDTIVRDVVTATLTYPELFNRQLAIVFRS